MDKPKAHPLLPVLAGAVALLFGAVLTIVDKFDVPTEAFNALVLLLFAGIPIMVVVALVQARLARAGARLRRLLWVLALHAAESN